MRFSITAETRTRILTMFALVFAGEMIYSLPFHLMRFFRPIPAVDGAVERAERLEPGKPVVGQRLEGVLRALHVHQGPESGHVLPEDVQYRVPDPAVSETDARS